MSGPSRAPLLVSLRNCSISANGMDVPMSRIPRTHWPRTWETCCPIVPEIPHGRACPTARESDICPCRPLCSRPQGFAPLAALTSEIRSPEIDRVIASLLASHRVDYRYVGDVDCAGAAAESRRLLAPALCQRPTIEQPPELIWTFRSSSAPPDRYRLYFVLVVPNH